MNHIGNLVPQKNQHSIKLTTNIIMPQNYRLSMQKHKKATKLHPI